MRVVHRLEGLASGTRFRPGREGRATVRTSSPAAGQQAGGGKQRAKRGGTHDAIVVALEVGVLHELLDGWRGGGGGGSQPARRVRLGTRGREERRATAGRGGGGSPRTIEQLLEDRGLGEAGFKHGGRRVWDRVSGEGLGGRDRADGGRCGWSQRRMLGGSAKIASRAEMGSRAEDARAAGAGQRRGSRRVSSPTARPARGHTTQLAVAPCTDKRGGGQSSREP